MASALGKRIALPRLRRERPAEVLRARDAAVSFRRPPPRSCEELHDRRCDRANDAHAGLRRAAPDGVGRLRPAGRERRDIPRHRPGDVDDAEHLQHAAPDALDGHQLRLVARDRHVRTGVLPLESVALLTPVRARAGVQARGAGELVPARQDRARQRAGRGRAMLALFAPGRTPQPLAVVPAHHRVRGPAARRHRKARRLAGPYARDAAPLDRAQRRRARSVRRGRPQRRHRSFHDPRRHALRCDVPGGRAGASGGRRDPALGSPGAGRGDDGLRAEPRIEVGYRTLEPHGEARRLYRRVRGQPALARARPDLADELRARGVRRRSGHGRARARRARLRVCQAVRTADRSRDRAGARRSARIARRALRGRRTADRERRFFRHVERARSRSDRDAPGIRGERSEGGPLPSARLARFAPALLGHAHSDRALRALRRGAGARGRAADRAAAGRAFCGRRLSSRRPAGVRRDAMPGMRRQRAARERYDGYVLRVVLVLSALSRSAQRPRALGGRARQSLDERRRVRRRRRARGHASALLALFLQVLPRPRLGERPRRAVREPVPSRARAAQRREDVQIARQRRRHRRDRREVRH